MTKHMTAGEGGKAKPLTSWPESKRVRRKTLRVYMTSVLNLPTRPYNLKLIASPWEPSL